MEIDRSFAHLVPRPECVVAQDQVMATLAEFSIVLDAGPPLRCRRRLRIIIPDDEVFPPIQFPKQSRTVSAFHRHEVAKMPDIVVLSDDGIPVVDDCSVMCCHV